MRFDSFLSYEEIDTWIEQYAEKNKGIAYVEIIGQSNEGRYIKAIHVTNNGMQGNDKEVALIIIGRHGDELGTRVVGPAVLDWLASEDARKTISRQHIIVVAVANPDACVHAVFGLPIYHLSSLEKRSILPLAARYIPDVVIDVHSVGKEKFGFNWGGLEAIVIDHNANAAEDQCILRNMAREMVDAAGRAGYPFLLHTLDPYQNLRKKADLLSEFAFNNHINGTMYRAFHSLTFGVEVNHFVLGPDDAAKSGLAVIKSLLEMGNKVFPWEYHPGYPNRILSGDFLASIRPRGKKAHDRRNSRKEVWSKRNFFEAPFNPYRKMKDDHSLSITVNYSGEEEITSGITISFRIRGAPKFRKLTANGDTIDYLVKRDECSTYVFVDLEGIRKKDVREIVAEF